MPNCLPFVDERRSVKCMGSAAGFSFPPHPLPPVPNFLLSLHPFARHPLGYRFLPVRGNGKDCYAGYRIDEKFIQQLSAMFTCRDGKGVRLVARPQKCYINRLERGAVYIASYKEPLDQSDCWKLFVQL